MSDDEGLIGQIAGGDEGALRQLYASYRVRLWQYLWPQLNGDAQRVEEVLQDVFLAMWRQAWSFRGEARASTWLFRIARNRASNAMRDRARQPDQYGTMHLLGTLSDGSVVMELIPKYAQDNSAGGTLFAWKRGDRSRRRSTRR